MAKYRITAPDGGTYEITAPDDATQEQILAYAQQNHKAQPAKEKPAEKSTLESIKGGLASAPINAYLGAKQLFSDLTPVERDVLKQNREAEKDAPVSSFVSNVGTYLPAMLVPGANTVVGGALIGGATGALQPTDEGENRLANTVVGAVGGAAIPAAIRGAQTIKAAAIDPFTQAGRDRIAGGVLNRATRDPAAVAQRLQAAQGATPGFNPTAGQAANDAGIAAIERAVRAVDPAGFSSAEQAQRAALADAVRGLGGDAAQRQALVNAREQAVQQLYNAAKSRTVDGDATLNALLQRPTVQEGMGAASRAAQDEGRNFALSAGRPAQTVSSGVLDAAGNPITSTIPAQPARYSGQALHDLKMGIDAAISGQPAPGMAARSSAAQNQARSDYLAWLESKLPEYQQARTTFQQMSQPINQMDVGNAMAERFIPALYRDMPAPQQLNSASLARAVTDQGDNIAREATGMRNATLEGVLTPQQRAVLNGVLSDAQAMKVGENMGRGAGSDTIQKTAMSHIAAEAGIPNWMASLMRVPGGWAKRAGDAIYGNADEQVRQRLAEALIDPRQAAAVMNSAGANPSAMSVSLQNMVRALNPGVSGYLAGQ